MASMLRLCAEADDTEALIVPLRDEDAEAAATVAAANASTVQPVMEGRVCCKRRARRVHASIHAHLQAHLYAHVHL